VLAGDAAGNFHLLRRFAAAWRWRYANPLAPPGPRARANLVAEAAAGYIAVSFWGLVGTAPLTAFHCNQFSLVAVIANAAVVPIMGLGAVVCGLIAAAMSFIWLPAAREIVWLAGHLVRLGTFLAGWFLKLPCARTRIFTPSIFEVAIAYAFIMLWLMRPLKGEELMRAAVKSDTNDTAMDSPRRQWRKVTTAI
jgi:hypothetical protein